MSLPENEKIPNGRVPTVLIAEDDADDRQLTLEAFETTRLPGQIRFVEDGEELLDYLLCRGKYAGPGLAPRPDVLLLDLNMPRKDGREALREIKSTDSLRPLRVVVLTTSRAEEDIQISYALSATSYITKPTSYRGLIEVVGAIAKYWLDVVVLPLPVDGVHAA